LRYRYRRFHISQLFLWLAVGILVGLGLGHFSGDRDYIFYIIAIALFFGALRSKRWWALIVMAVAGGLLGFVRGAEHRNALDAYAPLIGQKILLSGTLTDDPQDTSKGTTKLVLGGIRIDGKRYSGDVFVTTAGRVQLKRGDTVSLNGKVREGFATYPIAMSYAKLGSVVRHPDTIRDIRERFAKTLRMYVMEPMASLGLGFVVGQRTALPDTLDEQLKIVGLTHIVVASGYNLTILVRFMMRLFSRHSRYVTLVGSLALAFTFMFFSGFSPSMIRAVAVTVMGLLAWYIGRRFHPVYLLLFVAAGTALYNPSYVWGDLGWYLSFFAFAGVLIVSPLVIAWLYKKRRPTAVEQLVVETMSAEIMALPLIALAFGTLPIFGLLANVLVAPVIPFAMLLSAITGFVGMVLPVVGALFVVPTTIVIAYVIAIVEWLSSISWAQLSIDIPLSIVTAWYVLVVFICIWLWKRSGYDFRKIYRGHEV